MVRHVVKLRGLVEGAAEAPLLVYKGRLSFYGEVDPRTGEITGTDYTMAGRILLALGTRGSTVGSYIVYALAENRVAPAAIVVSKAEPILVAGAVMASIPLADGLPEGLLEELPAEGCHGRLESRPPEAVLEISC